MTTATAAEKVTKVEFDGNPLLAAIEVRDLKRSDHGAPCSITLMKAAAASDEDFGRLYNAVVDAVNDDAEKNTRPSREIPPDQFAGQHKRVSGGVIDTIASEDLPYVLAKTLAALRDAKKPADRSGGDKTAYAEADLKPVLSADEVRKAHAEFSIPSYLREKFPAEAARAAGR